MKKYYVGVDLHKKTSWFYVMDQDGNRISSKSITNQIWSLKEYFKAIPQPFEIAVETTYNWYFFVDLAREYTNDVYLANAYELKAFAKRNKKTDKIDARLIADVLRMGYLPAVYIPSKNDRDLKEFLALRMNITKKRTQTICRLKAILDKLALDSTGDFTTAKRLDLLQTKDISVNNAMAIEGYINQIRFYNEQLSSHQKDLIQNVSNDPDIDNLISIPGLSFFSAAIVKTEIGDITRFSTFNKLCSYAGLAPKTHQSGDMLRHGPLSKCRKKNLQWILIEVSIHFIKAQHSTYNKFQRIMQKRCHNVAKVAAARDMLKAIYIVLKHKRKYIDYNKTAQTQAALVLRRGLKDSYAVASAT